MFDRQRHVMTTMSEIVLVDSAGGLTCQGAVASVHGDNYTVRFRRGCHRYRWQVLSALGRWLGKDQASLLAEQKLQCVFLSAAVANPHQAGDAYINFANNS